MSTSSCRRSARVALRSLRQPARPRAGARYYRPRHGRFSQVDPVYAGLFDPQQWNRYAYARSNPLTFVDPDGRAISCYETGRGVRCNEDLTVTPESGSPHGPPLIIISGREPDCVPGLASRACGFVKNPVPGEPDPGDRRRCSPGGCGDEQVSQTINPPTDVLGQAAPVSQALATGAVVGATTAAISGALPGVLPGSAPTLFSRFIATMASLFRPSTLQMTPKVIQQMGRGDFHARFPVWIEKSVLRYGSINVDNRGYIEFSLPGSINGQLGSPKLAVSTVSARER